MSTEPPADESATDDFSAPPSAEADDNVKVDKRQSLAERRRVALEELQGELAVEPLASPGALDGREDELPGHGKALQSLGRIERAKFGSAYPAMKNFGALEALTRKPSIYNSAALEALQAIKKGPAFGIAQRDLTPALEAFLRPVGDWKAASGLADISKIVAQFGSANQALTTFSALDRIDTRSNLLSAMSSIDAGAFRHADLGGLAAAMSALDVNKTLLGSLAANASIHQTLGQFVAASRSNLMADLEGITDQWSQHMLDQVGARELLLLKATGADPLRRLLSARPLTAFSRYLDGFPHDPSGGARVRDTLAAGKTHGFVVDSLVAGDALLSPLDADERDEVIDIFESGIIEPWQEARAESGADLGARLAAVDPKLEEMYRGAWETLGAKRPGYVEATCHLAVEVLGRALHHLARDEDVRTWASQNGYKLKDIESQNGNLTRKIRLRYILRTGSRDERNLVVANVDALLKTADLLIGRLNAGRHNSVGTDVLLRGNLFCLEAVLFHIFN